MVRSPADTKIQVVVFTNRGACTLFICVTYRMGTLWGFYFMLSHPFAFRRTCSRCVAYLNIVRHLIRSVYIRGACCHPRGPPSPQKMSNLFVHNQRASALAFLVNITIPARHAAHTIPEFV